MNSKELKLIALSVMQNNLLIQHAAARAILEHKGLPATLEEIASRLWIYEVQPDSTSKLMFDEIRRQIKYLYKHGEFDYEKVK